MMLGYQIFVYPVGIEDELVEWTKLALESKFNAKIMIDSKRLKWGDIIKFYNHDRDQVDAGKLIEWLSKSLVPPPNSRVIVLLNGDGFVEGLNFVFGISKEGWGGIVFTARLKPIFYGQEHNETIYRVRIFKEILHELGHSFGLPHCNNYCVMRFSNSVYDVDRKPPEYCTKCKLELEYYNPGLLKI